MALTTTGRSAATTLSAAVTARWARRLLPAARVALDHLFFLRGRREGGQSESMIGEREWQTMGGIPARGMQTFGCVPWVINAGQA